MKIKDLNKDQSLGDLKVKTPNGVVGYWKSQWNKGVWLSDGESGNIYPQFIDDLQDCLNWDIVDENEKVNCHKKRALCYVDMTSE